MHVCKYCNKSFSQKYKLNRHQRTAKYCLSIQNKDPDTKYTCEVCGKKFPDTYHFKRHQQRKQYCKDLLEDDSEKSVEEDPVVTSKIKVLEEQKQKELDDLKALIDNMGDKGNGDTINNVQNMEPVSVGKIADSAIEHLDIKDLEKGIDAIVEFTAKYPLKDRVICMDRSRRKFKYVNEAGDIVIDYGGLQLSQTVFQGIQSRCATLIDNKYVIMMADVQSAVDVEEGYRDDVWTTLRDGSKLQDIKLSLNEAAGGVENEFQRSFIRKLAKKL